MNLSPSQEDQLFRSCINLVWSAVHQFRRRNDKNYSACAEDLFQEASIVMLEHIRRSPDMETARKAPLLDMTNAMCRYLMEMNVVHIPKRTTDFSKTISHPVDTSIMFDGLDYFAKEGSSAEDIETQADFDIFLGTLSKAERILVQQKMNGATTRDAGRAAGYGDATAMRVLQRVRKKYAAFAA